MISIIPHRETVSLHHLILWRTGSIRGHGPCFMGLHIKNPLEFRLIFGVNENRAAAGRDIDREKMAIVSSWLMGHQSYRWLTVDQPDMINMRYRCVITDLEMIEIGFSKWAYSCTVRCDSPYAYLYPQKFTFTVDGISTVQICSRSTANDVYYPHVEITLDDCANLSNVAPYSGTCRRGQA